MKSVPAAIRRRLAGAIPRHCMMLLTALMFGASLAHASPPDGLSASDWQAIRAQLPAHAKGGSAPLAQQAYLKAHNTDPNDAFGVTVAVSGDTVVVGAPGEQGSGTGIDPADDNAAAQAGAAYVFARWGNVWVQQAHLKAHNTTAMDRFGSSVAIHGDTVVVGAPDEDGSGSGVNPPDDNVATDAGAAYVFVRTGNIWSQQAYLKASNNTQGIYFGTSVAISADTVVVGAPYEDGGGANNSGAAYVFVRSGGVWSHQAYLKSHNAGVNDLFGFRVAVSGDTVAVGAHNEDGSGTGIDPADDNDASNSGAAYVFARSGSTWNQQAYLKPHNTGAGDEFGRALAVWGDTVVVGAPYEDGSGTGIDPADDNDMTNSGAAYVFVRSGGVWSQQAYLKAHNTGNDLFGSSVAIHGDAVVIGAPAEDGSGTGVDPADDDNANNSGAAYVFTRSGNIWSQQHYLKAHNTQASDEFGRVAIWGDTVVVGAAGEDGSGTGVNPADDNLANAAGAAYVFAVAQPIPATLTLAFNPSNPHNEQTVLLIATPAGDGSLTPGGSVDFHVGIVLVCAGVPVVAGVATCEVGPLFEGSYNVEAIYSGDANHTGASAREPLNVVQAPPEPQPQPVMVPVDAPWMLILLAALLGGIGWLRGGGRYVRRSDKRS